jgi:hypothetical protein
MCSTLVRIAEHYESPYFRDKVFTLKEFKKWYKKSLKKKRFTYYEDWSGYNIPSKYLKSFNEKFKDINSKERKFLDLFKNERGNFYVIATAARERTEANTIKHEVTHAMFALNKEYRQKVEKYLKGKDTAELDKYLRKIGYSGKVMIDELNAYLCVDLKWLRRKRLKGKQYDAYSAFLKKLRKKYEKV